MHTQHAHKKSALQTSFVGGTGLDICAWGIRDGGTLQTKQSNNKEHIRYFLHIFFFSSTRYKQYFILKCLSCIHCSMNKILTIQRRLNLIGQKGCIIFT